MTPIMRTAAHSFLAPHLLSVNRERRYYIFIRELKYLTERQLADSLPSFLYDQVTKCYKGAIGLCGATCLLLQDFDQRHLA